MSVPNARTPSADFDSCVYCRYIYDARGNLYSYGSVVYAKSVRSKNHQPPVAAINTDAGMEILERNQAFFPNQYPRIINAIKITVNWPSSTPMLNPIRAGINCVSGKPNADRTLANPNPCNNPKAKITKGRHFERRFENRFSTATKMIEAAIRGSTKVAGTLTSPSAAAAKVTVCASVKDVICQSKTDNFRLKKYNPNTKST